MFRLRAAREIPLPNQFILFWGWVTCRAADAMFEFFSRMLYREVFTRVLGALVGAGLMLTGIFLSADEKGALGDLEKKILT